MLRDSNSEIADNAGIDLRSTQDALNIPLTSRTLKRSSRVIPGLRQVQPKRHKSLREERQADLARDASRDDDNVCALQSRLEAIIILGVAGDNAGRGNVRDIDCYALDDGHDIKEGEFGDIGRLLEQESQRLADT